MVSYATDQRGATELQAKFSLYSGRPENEGIKRIFGTDLGLVGSSNSPPTRQKKA
jgi:hypothetical protein